ncbi:ARM repeat-containing protein [Pisolithus marmoratus]|nr:ARM repeat-containing protein [Pisolithus marmoratus]
MERHVRSWFASQKAAEIEYVVSALSSGECTLLDIVKTLGEYLTSEEDTLRTKVVEGCPKEKLNRQAETITPALRGLSHLVKSPAVASSDIRNLLNAYVDYTLLFFLSYLEHPSIFTHVKMRSHLDDLKAMGDEFVSGYATLASGEKDPRNLTVAFAIARVILTEFDISKHVEDYFDITFCYFPITFRPPPNDPYGISADDLKSSLLPCLSATPAFGRLGVPLFLEKLTAGSPVTKRDPLRAMSLCLPVYGPSVAHEFGPKIWSALKLEIFQPADAATEKAALNTLQAFVRVLQSSPVVTDEGQPDSMDDFVQTVCGDCLDAIGDPEKPQAKAGMKILCSFISIARMLFQYFSHRVLQLTDTGVENLTSYAIAQAAEKLVTIFHDPMEVSNRPSVIALLTDLLNSLAPPEDLPTPDKRVVTASSSTSFSQDLLTPSKDAVLGLLTVGLKAPSARVPSLHGLAALIRVPSAVTKDELGYIVFEVSEFVGKEPDEAEDSTSDVLSLLSSIATLAPQHLATQILPPLFLALPDRAPPRDAHSQRAAYWRALSALSQLCTHPELFETFVIRLTTKLDLLSSPLPSASANAPSTDVLDAEEMEPVAAYAHAILTALGNTLSAKVSKSRPDADVPNAYLDGRVKSITGAEFAFSSEEFKPMDAGSSTRQRNTLLLYAAAHVPMRGDVSLGRLANLVTWCSYDSCTASQREAVSHILASLVNKHADDIADFLSHQLNDYWSKVVYNRTIPASDRRNAVALWVSVWILCVP